MSPKLWLEDIIKNKIQKKVFLYVDESN
jgi:hypothetical protein